jgi:putative ABC transport system permease protein
MLERGLIRAASALVPRAEREDWRREWLAEIDAELAAGRHWPRRRRTAPALRCLGAFLDAAWLRLRFLQHGLWMDVRFGARALRRDPGFTAVALLTLALAMGANTAVFSIAWGVLFRTLPYHDPGRLVWLSQYRPAFNFEVMTPPDLDNLRARSRSFEALAAYTGGREPVATGGDSQMAALSSVEQELFSVLGVSPRIGRGFTARDTGVAILSHHLWRQQFGADPAVLGRTLRLTGRTVTVVGVMPPRFSFPDGTDLWLPLVRDRGAEKAGTFRLIDVVGRLKPGVTVEQARAEFETLIERNSQRGAMLTGAGAARAPAAGAQATLARVEPLHERIVGRTRRALQVLYAAVSMMLLIACVNIANLALARSAARNREMAVRAALGAGQVRLARQLLVESVLLAAFGAALGLLLVWPAMPAIISMLPEGTPRVGGIAIDAAVIAYAGATCLAAGCLFGLAPLALRRASLHDVLKASGRRTAGAGAGRWMHASLAASQLTLALVLLVGAGLLLRSFVHLLGRDLGFRPEGVLTVSVRLPDSMRNNPASARVREALVDSIRRVPGVTGAAATGIVPFVGENRRGGFSVPGQVVSREDQGSRQASMPEIDQEFFSVMGIPLIAGRVFEPGEKSVAVVNQSLARQLYPHVDPIGREVRMGMAASDPTLRIVGVVGDVRTALDASSKMAGAGAVIYTPCRPTPAGGTFWIVARAAGDPAALAGAVRTAARAADANAGFEIQTMEQALANHVAPQRFRTTLVGLFALVALALAGVGLYGVMSYLVAQRTYEMGVRVAVGAQPGDIARLVLGHGAKVILAGSAAGIALAFAATRYIASLLEGVGPRDAVTFIAVPALLAAIAFVACWIPARRAVRVDPAVVLRAGG